MTVAGNSVLAGRRGARGRFCDHRRVSPVPASRRQVLALSGRLAALGGVVLLGGCRLRLEDDAPPVPFVPRRSIPDEALLVAARRRAVELAALAAAVPGQGEVAARHLVQAETLLQVLRAGGVPDSRSAPTVTTAAATTPAAGPTASAAVPTGTPARPTGAAPGSTPRGGDRAALAHSEAAADLTGWVGAVAQRTVLVAVAVHDTATAALLGSGVVWPAADPLPVEVATELVAGTRAAAYGVEVAAARLPAAARRPLLDTLGTLRARERRLAAIAGPAGPVARAVPPGLDPQSLVRTVLGVLVEQGLRPVEVLPEGSRAAIEVARLQSEAVLLAAVNGVPVPALPGLVR